MYLGRNITYECMNVCCVSQSVIHHDLLERKGLMNKYSSLLLEKDKSCVIIVKDLIKIIVKFKAEFFFFERLYHAPSIFLYVAK